MNISMITVPQGEAYRQYSLYRSELSRRGKTEPYLAELSRAYYHMKKGRKAIDVIAAIQQAGLNVDGDPKFALSRAHWKEIKFTKHDKGAGRFADAWNNYGITVLEMPPGSFHDWPERKISWGMETIRQNLRVKVPIVPAEHLRKVKGALSRYHILWEVPKWDDGPPSDPILLQKINRSVYIVIAQWDLTPLEKALIRGR